MSIVGAGQNGRLAGLVALRDRLEVELDRCELPPAFASLSRQYTDVLLQIDGLDPAVVVKPATPLDELRLRREASKRAG